MAATTKEVFLFWTLLGRSMPRWFTADCSCLLLTYIQNHNVVLGLEDQQLTLSFHCIKCRRNIVSRDNNSFNALTDLTKTFDHVRWRGLLKLFRKIRCPPRFFWIIKSFHKNMQGTVQFDSSTWEPFPINSRVKQGYILTPMPFGIFFSLLLLYAFSSYEDGTFLYRRSKRKLSNLASLSKDQGLGGPHQRCFFFADDATLVIHSEATL